VFWETPPEVLARAMPLYQNLAALKMEWTLVKLALKYRPDQPREPTGNTDGGQWTDAGGGVRVAENDRDEGKIATDAGLPNPKPVQSGSRVVLPNGQVVANTYSQSGYLISPVSDLNPVATAGRDAGAIYQQMLMSPDTDIQQAALPQFIGSISASVGQGGTFDYQRRGSRLTGFTQLPEFRDVSNFNVGLYMQQTGQFSEEGALSLAGTFARYFSSNYMPDKPYGLDPRTARLIREGYRAGGVFGRAGK
jgi:hypothetical protein